MSNTPNYKTFILPDEDVRRITADQALKQMRTSPLRGRPASSVDTANSSSGFELPAKEIVIVQGTENTSYIFPDSNVSFRRKSPIAQAAAIREHLDAPAAFGEALGDTLGEHDHIVSNNFKALMPVCTIFQVREITEVEATLLKSQKLQNAATSLMGSHAIPPVSPIADELLSNKAGDTCVVALSHLEGPFFSKEGAAAPKPKADHITKPGRGTLCAATGNLTMGQLIISSGHNFSSFVSQTEGERWVRFDAKEARLLKMEDLGLASDALLERALSRPKLEILEMGYPADFCGAVPVDLDFAILGLPTQYYDEYGAKEHFTIVTEDEQWAEILAQMEAEAISLDEVPHHETDYPEFTSVLYSIPGALREARSFGPVRKTIRDDLKIAETVQDETINCLVGALEKTASFGFILKNPYEQKSNALIVAHSDCSTWGSSGGGLTWRKGLKEPTVRGKLPYIEDDVLVALHSQRHDRDARANLACSLASPMFQYAYKRCYDKYL